MPSFIQPKTWPRPHNLKWVTWPWSSPFQGDLSSQDNTKLDIAYLRKKLTTSFSRSRDITEAQKFNMGVTHGLGLAAVCLPIPNFKSQLGKYGRKTEWFRVVRVTHGQQNSIIRQSTLQSIYVPIWHRFWHIVRYWSKTALFNHPTCIWRPS